MATITVQFIYFTGFRRAIFNNPRLIGSWDENGRYSQQWRSHQMQQIMGEDGCPCFETTVELDDSQIGWLFRWGVMLDSPAGNNLWGIPTEINDRNSSDRYRSFTLQSPNNNQPQQERYYLVYSRRLGAQLYHLPGQSQPGLRFAVWAPNARNVEVVFGNRSSGYIADDVFREDPDFVWIPTLGRFPCPGQRRVFGKQMSQYHQNLLISPALTIFLICLELSMKGEG